MLQKLVNWGQVFSRKNGDLEQAINNSFLQNPWFEKRFSWQAVEAIKSELLNLEKLEAWLDNDLTPRERSMRIGLIMAGNLPLVGFHDLLCVLVSGHKALVKLSSKDQLLLPYLVSQLVSMYPELEDRIDFVDQFRQNDNDQKFDAVIATGTNNSARYFKYYFGKYPHIIRRNRNSIAILKGNETSQELESLGSDVFSYFGLGCRSVSKIYIPTGYEPQSLYEYWHDWSWVMQNDKYKNNFDYNRTLLLMNKVEHFTNDFMLMVEDKSLQSRIASLHFEYYDSLDVVEEQIKIQKNHLQCVVGSATNNENYVAFGCSQSPGLNDYADGVNTLEFLQNLKV